MSVLRRVGVGEDKKQLRINVPTELADELDALDADAKRAGFELPRDEIVTKALRKALDSARKELARAETNGGDAPPATRVEDTATAE